MKTNVTYEDAKKIMGSNMIGLNELRSVSFLDSGEEEVPRIPFSRKEIETKKNDYLLILGIECLSNGKEITIRNLKKIFGEDPDANEPCFYNQDWYNNETFIDLPMKKEWFFIRKNVYEDSRGRLPAELLELYRFPSAISCTYAFFVAWHVLGIKLWYHDFVWCHDVDHNGDRIYVGKYHDVDGVNKNGFSIHRHLALRPCYGCID